MEITVKAPMVEKCSVTECAYNKEEICHALAITVGDNTACVPRCDTYFPNEQHSEVFAQAVVGACKASCCVFNQEFECAAGAIRVDHHGKEVDCVTFKPR